MFKVLGLSTRISAVQLFRGMFTKDNYIVTDVDSGCPSFLYVTFVGFKPRFSVQLGRHVHIN
ncbi:hypothetical protein BDQ17DRAFT_1008692 [Cyathus striatus]|nr:hypothetical protein BDQ17DRAFT_1008692 [Cyathus striatus]